jgi:hypothetical protein
MIRTLSLSLLIAASLLTSGCLSNPHSSLRPRNHRVSMKHSARELSVGSWFTSKRAERQARRQAKEWEKQMAHQPAYLPYQPAMGPGYYDPMMNGSGFGAPAMMAQPTYFPNTDMAMMDMGMMNPGMMDPAMMGMMPVESGDCGCGMPSPMMEAPMAAQMAAPMTPMMADPMMGGSSCGCSGGGGGGGGGVSAGLPTEFHAGEYMSGEVITEPAPAVDPIQKPAESAGPANVQPPVGNDGLVPMPVAPQT